MPSELRIIGLDGIGEPRPGDDLVPALLNSLEVSGVALQTGDILVVTHKIVSKAEGRLLDFREIEPSSFARQWAARHDKDPAHIEVVLREARRIARMDRGLIIAETAHGFVCANAGVDASNVFGEECVCLLPLDPDASARQIQQGLKRETGLHIPVIITDSFGRAWRNGVVNVAIGLAGLLPLVDYRGQYDPYGYLMSTTLMAVADELASAAELAMGKVDQRPVALVRGYAYQSGTGSGQQLVMPPERDLFR